MPQLVTINNVAQIEYTALMDLLHDVYCKELPPVDATNPVDVTTVENLMIFFSNQYAYMVELWARMAHEVRLLKRTSKNKDEIDLAMDKRDYLDKVMESLKVKYYSARAMVRVHSEEIK